MVMKLDTVRYTATLPMVYIDELKTLAKDRKIPSVNHVINEALDEYMKNMKAAQYEALMKAAGRDDAFLARTVGCSEDFRFIDSEVSGEW